jgi:hypothetical protein
MHKTSKIIAAAATVVAVAAGGAAFTANAEIPATSIAGYGSSTIEGGETASSLKYGLSADGAQIATATIKFPGDLTGSRVVKAGFGTDTLTTCTLAFASAETTATCDGFTAPTGASTSFKVAVTEL